MFAGSSYPLTALSTTEHGKSADATRLTTVPCADSPSAALCTKPLSVLAVARNCRWELCPTVSSEARGLGRRRIVLRNVAELWAEVIHSI